MPAWVPGTGAKCTWTVKQPAGSNEQLLPSSTFANPTLVASAAGDVAAQGCGVHRQVLLPSVWHTMAQPQGAEGAVPVAA